ncbi:alpha/beta hydrolase-fold protein [Spirosoma foliorum]|uniref:Alpha/beta hydrolase n=1 Tax=Spirosoma foliorum TaxID=2710596 RepID=A0A7G5GZT0_9BACT|nr:alpha/beta hydrolase-fold protein [Spirosoma foliorum]QMW04372.1 alpha/beta hydrolase [Spirosoma foliorum]
MKKAQYCFFLIFCLLALSFTLQAQQRLPPIKSPEVADGGLTFRLRAPNAKEVILDIEGISKETMVKDDQGVWSFTKKLDPDVYDYAFVVDGLRIPDPANPVAKPCYQCNGQSLAHMPGPASLSWEIKDVPRGAVNHQVYRSAVMGEDRDYYVYLPPNYDPKRKEPYPVFFLLHGATGTALSWIVNAQANIILDNLIAEGKAKPMIMVNTLGYGGNDKYATEVIQEIIPQVEKTYNAAKDRTQRAIVGLSMGGGTAYYTGLNHLDHFAYVGGMSSAVGMGGPRPPASTTSSPATTASSTEQATAMMDVFAKTYPKLDEKANSQLKLLWVACGVDDFLYQNNKYFREYLSSKNVKFTYHETPGGHTFMVWRRNLTDLAPLLFR